MRTLLQVLASNKTPRYPKVGEKVVFVKYRCGKTGLAFGHAKVEEVIDKDHLKVWMIEKEFWSNGEEGKRILTWSEKYKSWRGRRGNRILS